MLITVGGKCEASSSKVRHYQNKCKIHCSHLHFSVLLFDLGGLFGVDFQGINKPRIQSIKCIIAIFRLLLFSPVSALSEAKTYTLQNEQIKGKDRN